MPMNFAGLDRLRDVADVLGCRPQLDCESEAEYRLVVAAYCEEIDFIQSHEIRNSVGWDQFIDEQKRAMVKFPLPAMSLLPGNTEGSSRGATGER